MEKGRPRAERDQRADLLAAMVAASDEKGVENTSVADLLERSGVSRATFYKYFHSKADCFRAAVSEAVRIGVLLIAERLGDEPSSSRRGRPALEAFIDLVVAEPAAARMCLVDAYGAGSAGRVPARAAFNEASRLVHAGLLSLPGREEVPLELARGVTGSLALLIHRRLRNRTEGELHGFVEPILDWMETYRAPPRPLRPAPRRGMVSEAGMTPPFAAYDPEQRLIRAFAAVVARKGYRETKIADIAAAASISQSTFYAHFDDKEDALLAALDSSGAQLLAATLPPARRAKDPASAVRLALGAMCGFLAAEPDFAQLRLVAVYAAGPEAIARRDAAMTKLVESLLGPAAPDGSGPPPLLTELIIGAIYGALYEPVRTGRASSLPDSAALLTYLALAPILGADQACEVAIGAGRGG
jgi:AcrR family transcriptional regulator